MTDVVLVPPLRTPAEAVAYLVKCDDEIKHIEVKLKDAKARRRKVEIEVGPDLFDRAELREVTLPSGVKAVCKMFLEGSLPKASDKDPPDVAAAKEARRERALAWAMSEEVGWGPFVKTNINLSFDKGDSDAAAAVISFVRSLNSGQPTIKVDEGIHAMTLQSQALKRLQEGKSLPTDDLGLTVLTGVKITKKSKEHS